MSVWAFFLGGRGCFTSHFILHHEINDELVRIKRTSMYMQFLVFTHLLSTTVSGSNFQGAQLCGSPRAYPLYIDRIVIIMDAGGGGVYSRTPVFEP